MKSILAAFTGNEEAGTNPKPINLFYGSIIIVTFILAIH